jgi:hypothetical protein
MAKTMDLLLKLFIKLTQFKYQMIEYLSNHWTAQNHQKIKPMIPDTHKIMPFVKAFIEVLLKMRLQWKSKMHSLISKRKRPSL